MSTTAPEHLLLESGDRLTRAEFHRRYRARPDIKKAELIQGVVYVASPARHSMHGDPHLAIAGWLYTYRARTIGVEAGAESTIFLDENTEVQPDAFLSRLEPEGRLRITEKGYLEGVPDLVVEIAASSASYDLHDKLRAYERAGVPEYIVWQVLEKRIDWLRLRDGQYVQVEPDARGVIESAVFPGLRLAVAKILAGDHAGVLAELQRQAEA